jgi:hypothetical protein
MAMSPEFKALFRGSLNFSVLLVGLASGVAQLADLPSEIGRRALQAVGIACLLYFVVRLWLVYFVARVRQLRQQVEDGAGLLAVQQAGHKVYLDAIERISDREKPLFSETLELNVTIGTDDGSDLIVEKRRTTPEPLVTHRTMRPIVPVDEERVVRLEEIGFKPDLRNGAPGTITPLPLREQIRFLRVWLVFDPALTVATDWEVEYRPRGLWRPLRERGWDRLAWDDRLPTANGAPSALTNFVVNFRFPDSDQPPSVKERNGWGVMAGPHRMDGTGQWLLVWRDERPAGRRYEWDLTQATG